MPTPFGKDGCRYLVDDRWHQCGVKEQPGSSYCAEHHALCYLARNSVAEGRRLRLIDRIGDAVGGRQAASALAKLMLKIAAIEGHA